MAAKTEVLVVVLLLMACGLAAPLPASQDHEVIQNDAPEDGNALGVVSPLQNVPSWSRTADPPSDLLMDSPDSHPDLTVALTRQHAPQQPLQRSRRDAEEEAELLSQQPGGDDFDDPEAGSQHFFPSFAPLFQAPPPLGHSRPQILFQEPSQRPSILRAQHNPFQPLTFGVGAFKAGRFQQTAPSPVPVEAPAATKGILGSGNFGVIRGGTFYDDGDRAEASEYGGGDVYNPYYNGHGRPSFYGGASSNPKPQHSNDFFANFRDFADINAPTKSSFSEFYVVYVNKNASRHDAGVEEGGAGGALVAGASKPKNIIEQLKMLDQESQLEDGSKNKYPLKTLSLGKKKLAHLQQDKYDKQQGGKVKTTAATLAKDLYEPLLALS